MIILNNGRPIGILDSGVGGLTVAKEVMRQLPHEQIVYVGDNARCPYGPRPADEVARFTLELVDFLVKKDVKMIVIACNTATAVALPTITEHVDIPVIGVVEAGARAAILTTKNKLVAVIGTVGTIRSQAYVRAVARLNAHVVVTGLACPKLVPIVESGEMGSDIAQMVVADSLAPLVGSGIDTLVLGCTHYPLLADEIAHCLGSDVEIICSAAETAREASTVLSRNDLLSSSGDPDHMLYTTGSITLFEKIARDWLAGVDFSVKSLS